jgi:hypothetical protein
MKNGIIVLICQLLLIIPTFTDTVCTASAGDEISDELISILSKSIKFDPISCPDNTECLCVEVAAKLNIPLRYQYSKWCPVDTENKRTSIGTWNVTMFDKEWNKIDEGQYVNGKIHGRWISWGPNGTVIGEIFYEEGAPIGVFTSWHENGVKAVTGGYLKGKPDGVWIYRDKDGQITRRLVWEDGNVKSNETFK